jgi:hypothetical protein
MARKNIKLYLFIIGLTLLTPLIAMQFTNEVNWNIMDFIVAGFLLLGTGLACNFVIQKVKNTKFRIAICLAILVLLFLIWAELAVGIF